MPEVVLLPGWGFAGSVLEPLAAALRERDVAARVAELPMLAEGDPDAWLAVLDDRLPADGWLAGWSLGGMLAVSLAAHRGERCAGVITLASNARFVANEAWPEAMQPATFAAFRDACAADPEATLGRFAMLCSQGCAQPRGLARALSAGRADWRPNHLLAGLDVLASLDNQAPLAGLRQPQLHLFAEQDTLVSAGAAAALAALNPRASVSRQSGGHAWVVPDAVSLADEMARFMGTAHD